jgi:hypothetical protein
VLQGTGLIDNVLLNLPHVVISSIMLFLAYRGRTSAPGRRSSGREAALA